MPVVVRVRVLEQGEPLTVSTDPYGVESEEGETMYDLSQRYAVRLRNLYMYNGMKEGDEPIPGQKIYLQPRKK